MSTAETPAPEPTLDEAIIEVEKTVRERARFYPERVKNRGLTQATADMKLARMRKAQSALTFLSDNIDWIIPEWQRRRQQARDVHAGTLETT